MTALGNGGAETYATDAMLALQEAGADQAAYVAPQALRTQELVAAGLRVTAATSRFRPLMRRALKRLIAREQPDVIHCWMRRAGEICPAQPDTPVIGWLGGYYPPEAYKTASHFIGVTHDISRHLGERGVPAERRFVVHTFPSLPKETPPPVPRASLDTPESAPLLLALSRLHAHKALDTLLNALAQLPDCYLWIAGDGALEGALKAQAAALGITERVRFLGWRSDGAALLQACDVCVLPSRIEPFGTVIIEAWAAGRPLVAARAAGPAAYVTDGVTGLLHPIDDAAALKEAVRRVVDDAALRAAMVTAGKAAYENGFTRAASVAGLLKVYEQARSGVKTPWR